MKYFTAGEVAQHNSGDDCWVSIFDDVYDITPLIQENKGVLAEPLIAVAGQSISHWFLLTARGAKEVRTAIDPVRNIRMPYTPHGRFIHVPAPEPMSTCASIACPWWVDSKYIIGKLTKKTRQVRVINMLSRTEDTINTCEEETINDIRDRYMEYNSHGGSYTWKALIGDDFIPLDMSKTLALNGLPDDGDKFMSLGLNEDFYIPTLHIYFNDDLTYA